MSHQADATKYDIFDQIADIIVAREQKWRAEAACIDHDLDLFFPHQNSPSNYMAAKKVCSECPVAIQCLEDWQKMPVSQQHHGVRFGTTDKDRRSLKNRKLL